MAWSLNCLIPYQATPVLPKGHGVVAGAKCRCEVTVCWVKCSHPDYGWQDHHGAACHRSMGLVRRGRGARAWLTAAVGACLLLAVAAAPAAAKKFVPTRYDDPAPGACKVARS